MVWHTPEARWTPEMDALLRGWRNEGCSFGVIAKKLDKTRNACIGRSHRLGMQTGDHMPPVNLWRKKRQRAPQPRSYSRPYTPRTIREPVMAEVRPIPPDTPWKTTKPLGEPASLMERHPQGCCFLPGDDHIYCNSHRLAAFDYCPEHYSLTHRATPSLFNFEHIEKKVVDVMDGLKVAA